MPRKVRRSKQLAHRITPPAIEAWQTADYMALHRALNLRPWQPSPLPVSITALGVDPDQPPAPDGRPWSEAWPLTADLQAELYRIAGEPGGGVRAA